jgi:hypothetical protein
MMIGESNSALIPFLCRYEIDIKKAPAESFVYDEGLMMLAIDGEPVIFRRSRRASYE